LALFANSSLLHAAIHILLRHSSRKNLSNPVRKVAGRHAVRPASHHGPAGA